MSSEYHRKPLCIDLFAGLGGWSEGFLAEGYRCVGFDTERHDYGTGGYPGELVLQDVLTLHGSQFKDAAVIVASPPCQEFSYMAMPWARAKQIAAALRGDRCPVLDLPSLFPRGYTGSRTVPELTALFDAYFRIQREAIEAAGHHIPLVVENVKGAQPWVGQARAHFGSFYLWGDVGMVGGAVVAGPLRIGEYCRADNVRKLPQDVSNEIRKGNSPARWTNPAEHHFYDGRKVPSMTGWDKFGQPDYKPQGFNIEAAKRLREGTKNGKDWFSSGENCSLRRKASSKSGSRKAASAQIAKIPLPLSSYIARALKPTSSKTAA